MITKKKVTELTDTLLVSFLFYSTMRVNLLVTLFSFVFFLNVCTVYKYIHRLIILQITFLENVLVMLTVNSVNTHTHPF